MNTPYKNLFSVDWVDMTLTPWHQSGRSYRYKKSKPKSPKPIPVDSGISEVGKQWQRSMLDAFQRGFDGNLLPEGLQSQQDARFDTARTTGQAETRADMGGFLRRFARQSDTALQEYAWDEVNRNDLRMDDARAFDQDQQREDDWQWAAAGGLDHAAQARGVAAQQLGNYNQFATQLAGTPSFMQQLSGGLGQAAGMMYAANRYGQTFVNKPLTPQQTMAFNMGQGPVSASYAQQLLATQPATSGFAGTTNSWMNP